jgi:hypothetical protein
MFDLKFYNNTLILKGVIWMITIIGGVFALGCLTSCVYCSVAIENRMGWGSTRENIHIPIFSSFRSFLAEREHFKDLMDFTGVSDPRYTIRNNSSSNYPISEKLVSLDRSDNSLSNDMQHDDRPGCCPFQGHVT